MNYLQQFSYNLEIAKVLGVSTSIFLSCVDTEYYAAIRNKNLAKDNTFAMSRSEIYERTGLDDEKQVEVETSLTACDVLTVKPLQNIPNKHYYILNYDQLNKIMFAENPTDVILNEKAKQFIQKRRVEPTSKRQAHIKSLKNKITIEDPVIQEYLCNWIDAVYSKPKGFLSPTGVSIAQDELVQYTTDQGKQIELLKIAIKGGLRDLTWAIEQYEAKAGVGSRNFTDYNDNRAEQPADSAEVF